MVKSDTDGSLIKAPHVHRQKESYNLVYGTKPRHNPYVPSNIIHFRRAGTEPGEKVLLSPNFATGNTCPQATCLFLGGLMNKGRVAIILKTYFKCIQFESRLVHSRFCQ
jgi:hypothetical protein